MKMTVRAYAIPLIALLIVQAYYVGQQDMRRLGYWLFAAGGVFGFFGGLII
jgi:hypothetical protein